MSADLINLRQARKRKARAEREKTAAANRAAHGRTSAERSAAAAERDSTLKKLDAHRRDTPPK